MHTSTHAEETTGTVQVPQPVPGDAAQGVQLEAGLRRDQRWRELRRQSLQAEIRALDRAPLWAALITFFLVAAGMGGWILYGVVTGQAQVGVFNWIGVIVTPLTVALIPAMMMRTLAQGVCQGLRRIILRRAKIDCIELPDESA